MSPAARASSRGLAAGLALALLAVAPAGAQEAPTAPDLPSGRGTIAGVVKHRASGQPVPDAQVVIYALSASGAPGLRRLQADVDGAFRVSGIAADAGVTYLVGARFDEISYPGARVSFEPGQSEVRVEISVSERTSDPEGVSLESMLLGLSPAPDGLRVVEVIGIRAAGERAVYASPAERAGARPALSVALPAGARDFQMPLGVVPEGVVRDGDTIRFYGPVYPGTQELSWSYTLPPDSEADPQAGSRFALDRRFPDAVGRLELRLPEGSGRASGPELVLEPDSEESAEGRRLQVYARPGLASGSRLALEVTLPPSRVDPDAVSVLETRLLVHGDDAAADVSETHRLTVTGDTQVLGTTEQPLLHVPLPEDARRLRFGTDGPGVTLVPAPQGGLAAVGSAAPGPLTVELSYRLPVESPPLVLTRRFSRAVPLLTIFLADDGRWRPVSDRLHRRKPVRTSDLTYMHLEAFQVDPDEAVSLRVETLPARTSLPDALLLGGVLLTALGVIWLLVTPLLGRGEEAAEREAAVPATTREREALLQSIHDLEHDFETGKVSEADHDSLRGELRARAVALLREEREGSAAEAETLAAAPACSACGAPAAAQHRFCAQCGAELAQGAPAKSLDAPAKSAADS